MITQTPVGTISKRLRALLINEVKERNTDNYHC